jgi:hypothetical protein
MHLQQQLIIYIYNNQQLIKKKYIPDLVQSVAQKKK